MKTVTFDDKGIIKPPCTVTTTSGLYYKNILTIVSDNVKLCLYYKCLISPILSLSYCRQLRP
jgi:hypothetical protein